VIPNAAVPDIGQLIPPIFASAAEKSKTKRGKYGTSYSPYRADSTCKGQSEVDRDIHALREFGLVRIYGVDCDQARTVSHAVRQHSHMRVFAGIYDLSHIDGDLQTLIAAAAGDWAIFHTVSIGNELVNKGENTPAEVIGAVNGARQSLRAAGYDGPVVTVDTFNKLIEHPDLCAASDYCAANCHAFFDATQTAETAGPYVAEQARLVSQAVGGGKSTMITESGWPYAGVPNGKAIPSKENQELAIRSLEDSFPDGGLILFSAFDDRWKQDNAWTFATEKFWGFLHR
jgi:exo-beta-1,3-glucanase (GH17 family)